MRGLATETNISLALEKNQREENAAEIEDFKQGFKRGPDGKRLRDDKGDPIWDKDLMAQFVSVSRIGTPESRRRRAELQRLSDLTKIAVWSPETGIPQPSSIEQIEALKELYETFPLHTSNIKQLEQLAKSVDVLAPRIQEHLVPNQEIINSMFTWHGGIPLSGREQPYHTSFLKAEIRGAKEFFARMPFDQVEDVDGNTAIDRAESSLKALEAEERTLEARITANLGTSPRVSNPENLPDEWVKTSDEKAAARTSTQVVGTPTGEASGPALNDRSIAHREKVTDLLYSIRKSASSSWRMAYPGSILTSYMQTPLQSQAEMPTGTGVGVGGGFQSGVGGGLGHLEGTPTTGVHPIATSESRGSLDELQRSNITQLQENAELFKSIGQHRRAEMLKQMAEDMARRSGTRDIGQ
jgi:hypothetical protein